MKRRDYPEAPVPAVGGLVLHDGAVLLIRRARPPSRGVWAVPGGRVELGETLAAATEREVREETEVEVRAREPIWSFDSVVRDPDGRIAYHYVIVDLAADYVAGTPRANDDAAEARWVRPAELSGMSVSAPTLELLARVGFHPGRDVKPLAE